MKVLVLSCATYADPATRKVWDRVAAQGVEVTLALPARVRHPFAPAVVPDTPWPTPGVRLVRLDTWYLHENGTHIVMKGVARLIREARPDVVHCVMEPWSITCLEALVCVRRMSPRPRFGVQAAEFRLEQGTRLAARVRKSLFKSVVSRSDFFIGWSPRVLEQAARLGLNGQPSAAIPAVGVDVGLFRPADAHERHQTRAELSLAAPSDFLVGFVGRFVPEKGVEDLVTAMDRAIAQRPGLRLALLGTGPLEPALVSAAASRPWMRLLPPTDRAGVALFLRALDMLVLPSRATSSVEEQFGLVLAEAMACGVQVAGSDCGAIPDVIGAERILPQADAGGIAHCILSAARDGLLGSGAAARRGRVTDRFADDVVARKLVEVWEAIG